MRLRAVIALVSLVMFSGIAGCDKPHVVYPPEKVDRPETGYRFPESSNIAAIRVAEYCAGGSSEEISFQVPVTCWDAILAAISPSQLDDDDCVTPWLELAELEIRTTGGESHFVQVYDLEDQPVGAFAAWSSDNRERAYRGGNTFQFRQAIEKAYEEYSSGRDGKRR